MSDSDTSASKLGCSAVINESDDHSSLLKNVKNTAGTSQISRIDNASQKSDTDMQMMINVRALDQLDQIGQRLDKIERKDCKKYSDKSKIKSSVQKTSKTKKAATVGHQLGKKHKTDFSTSMTDEALLQLRVDQRM